MTKTYYYFIITPLNYLNALEFKYLNNLQFTKHNLIIITDHSEKLIQLTRNIEINQWYSVNFLFNKIQNIRKRNIILFIYCSIIRRVRLFFYLNRIEEGSTVILGNYNNNYCKYINQKFKNKRFDIVYLDDGFASLDIPKQLEKSKIFPINEKPRSFLESFIFGNFFRNINKITLFTVFELKSENIKIIKNNYILLGDKNRSTSTSPEVFFIGQPIQELNILPSNIYINTVEKIRKYYTDKGFDFVYILHSSEIKSKKPKEWKLRSFDSPIEIVVRNLEIKPKIFATFYSTACFNLMMIYSDKLLFHFWHKELFELYLRETKMYEYILKYHNEYITLLPQ